MTLDQCKQVLSKKAEQDTYITALINESIRKPISVIEIREELRNDKLFMLRLVEKDGRFLALAPEELRKNADVVSKACQQNWEAIQLSLLPLQDSEIPLLKQRILHAKGISWKQLPAPLDEDKDLILQLIQKKASYIRYSSEKLLDAHPDLVEAAIKKKLSVFKLLPEPLKKTESVKNMCREQFLNVLEGDNYRKNPRDLNLLADAKVSMSPISDFLAEDRDLMLELVKKNGCLLRFGAQEIRKDPIVALEAVQENPAALKFVIYDSEDQKFSKVLNAFKINIDKLVEKSGGDISFIGELLPEFLTDNKAYMLNLIEKNGLFLQFASKRLRKDEDIILKAFDQNPASLEYSRMKKGITEEFRLKLKTKI